ncbi:hypothetical protein CDL15_Pgr020211 [Punica granatum]|uniref:Uncharacterized protein n=1 Tax=Punica granatum TaxID=22663 RepID=A0A218VQV5_PUNGR|nr:hypothetical protein CDL15_Pgr020211 [Punica granatum]
MDRILIRNSISSKPFARTARKREIINVMSSNNIGAASPWNGGRRLKQKGCE